MAIPAKITSRTKKIIQEIAHETGESQINVLDHAAMVYHREWRMQKINEAYAKLKQNKRAWKEVLKERSILEQTSNDGLDDE